MPRFPVSFGKRRSTVDNLENAPVATSSFRVLDRTEVGQGKTFDGGIRLSAKSHTMPKTTVADLSLSLMEDDNIFSDMNKPNRGSGSSNTTKTTFTDNSSRHSNASTAPSSATDYSVQQQQSQQGQQDESKGAARKPYGDIPLPPIPKSSSGGFLKAAGRTFSFGAAKKNLPPVPADPAAISADSIPPVPPLHRYQSDSQHDNQPEYHLDVVRSRATTTSTTSTATPPKVEEGFTLDLGGDFSSMLSFEKRQSVMTLKDESTGRQALGPRSLTGNRMNQPSPIQIDKTSHIDASPLSWSSQHSDEQLLVSSPARGSPTNENLPPAVPRHGSPLAGKPEPSLPAGPGLKRRSATYGRRLSAEAEDEDTMLLNDISAASKYLRSAGAGADQSSSSGGRYRRNEERQISSEFRPTRRDAKDEDLFDVSLATSSRLANRYISRKPSPPRNKVMTPAQFERYRQDKERQGTESEDDAPKQSNDDDEDNYEDDEDEIEKAKQAAKQRRKQDAHMAVYRQQMMKVTGESASPLPSRPSMTLSMSAPHLPSVGAGAGGPSPVNGGSDGSDEDEEVPLAILAAHGFPSKNRPPARLSTMMSNPNLRAAAQTSSYQRPGSAMETPVSAPASGGGNGGRLPVFARALPQDPYVGAGLVNPAVRESLSFGGGSPAPGVPPGGLVGVIASEERSRAMRRGSPAIDSHKPMLSLGGSPGAFDPVAGIPSQMMYPQAPAPGPAMMTPQDQAQMQMNQQMQQFMQMQMQFMQMQMMAAGQNNPAAARMSMLMPNASMGNLSMGGPGVPGMLGAGMGMGMGMGGPETMRHSFIDNGSVFDLPMRPESHVRSMSMVQPSSASWIQPAAQPQMGGPGYAPSIRIQGANGLGYAPSIAPSERSNIGLPGRYRPVSHMPAASPSVATPPPMQQPSISPVLPDPMQHQQFGPPQGGNHLRKSSTMSGALGSGAGWDQDRRKSPLQNSRSANNSDNEDGDEEDEEKAWAAMQQKREKKKSLWKTKKSIGSEIGALIS